MFNGFDGLVKSMYGVFDPELVVVPAEGKVFDIASVDEEAFAEAGVGIFLPPLEENVLLEYRGRQTTARLRGRGRSVTKGWFPYGETVRTAITNCVSAIWNRRWSGRGLLYDLGVKTALYDPLNVYAVRRGEYSSLLPIDGYRSGALSAGIFRLDAGDRRTRMLQRSSFAQELLDYPGKRFGYCVKGGSECRPGERQGKNWRRDWADHFRVMTRYEPEKPPCVPAS